MNNRVGQIWEWAIGDTYLITRSWMVNQCAYHDLVRLQTGELYDSYSELLSFENNKFCRRLM